MIIFKTWLLKGIFHSAPGYIEIDGDNILFTLIDTGTFGKRNLNALLDNNQAYQRITNGEAVNVFNVPRKAAKYESPWYMMNGGGVLTSSGQKYKLSFMQPQNTKFPYQRLGIICESDFTDFSDGRKIGKRFQSFMSNPNSSW